jgi:hypothetical protein
LGASRAASRNNAPAVYYQSFFVRDGGLLSYGAAPVDIFRRATSYVDRILRGEKPGDLPVQFPTKFEMVVNRKTLHAAGAGEVPEWSKVAAHRGEDGKCEPPDSVLMTCRNPRSAMHPRMGRPGRQAA